ncbi:hypothetical protein NE237_005052 [Protea cynaroides]|uniref:Pectinesterase inhibitor domain-containing protein n=1 Tax=Protea cynaroides TaxID=273540 RepID=A0A9Q0QU35_9MAGN|nr:hypothetical protein NE237_005052 [Protea cynaroides]
MREKPSQPETFIPTSIAISSIAPFLTLVINSTDTAAIPNPLHLPVNPPTIITAGSKNFRISAAEKMVTKFENVRILVTVNKISVNLSKARSAAAYLSTMAKDLRAKESYAVKDCVDNMGDGVAKPFGTTEIGLPQMDLCRKIDHRNEMPMQLPRRCRSRWKITKKKKKKKKKRKNLPPSVVRTSLHPLILVF